MGRVALLRDANAPAAPVLVRAPRVRFPGRQGWLVRVLGIVTEAAAKTVAATRGETKRGATKPKVARVPVRVRGLHQRRDVWDWSPGPIRPPSR